MPTAKEKLTRWKQGSQNFCMGKTLYQPVLCACLKMIIISSGPINGRGSCRGLGNMGRHCEL